MKLFTKIGIGVGVAAGLGFVIVKGIQKIAEDFDDMILEDLTEDDFECEDEEIAEDFDKEDEIMAEEEQVNSSENFTEATDDTDDAVAPEAEEKNEE